MKTVEVSVPMSEETVRNLAIGDVVFMSGIIHTLRDSAYERALASLREGRPLPFSFKDGAIWHCGPIVAKTDSGWRVTAAGSTTSSRFDQPAAELLPKMGMRAIIGKGLMGEEIRATMQRCGACHLVTTGGAGAYYAKQITNVLDVHWLDLGKPAAVWVLSVERLGPLLVGIDSKGRSFFDSVRSGAEGNIAAIFEKLRIDPFHEYVWWPRRRAKA
jgi:fumarate hydratase subunit beta